MLTFPVEMVLQIGAVRRDGTLPIATDVFSTIRTLWQGARSGRTALGNTGPLQASNANIQQRRDRRGPV